MNRRVAKRIEVVNERAASDEPGAFDFVVEGGTSGDLTLGLLASYLGAAAAQRSAALDLSLDVTRVVVEVEHEGARSDGGTVDPADGDDLWRATPEQPSPRVRALVEADTDEPTDHLTTWRDQLVGDEIPFSMVPGLVGIDLLVRAQSRGRVRSTD